MMKVVLIFLAAFSGLVMPVDAQSALPTSGPSFSSKDTTKADVISVASLQVYPVGIDREGTEKEEPAAQLPSESKPLLEKEANPDQGPIRDWSNPPGFMGYSKNLTMTKHKPLTPKKYHGMKKNRCYSF